MFLQQHENKQTTTMYDWSSPRPRLAHKWVSEAQHLTLVPWDTWLVDVGWFVLPSGKLTWQWKIPFSTREYIFKRAIFHCQVLQVDIC